ncbi:MAG: 2-nitropropane dioxygenase [Bdellovibrionales bacterium GWA2_49_15]|nr:MAG: 2-nitropropane dioxygenase [Bdellovibrionales bacterium GWA2_49_15]HAZ15000.1 2-nitropropane dioxygenase [Bdellovibrionales bacterium]
MDLPVIIQGGMGIGVSDWRLAKAVSLLGQLGVVSGTGINTVLIRRLQDGDGQGDVRRAMAHFPDQDYAQNVLQLYFLPQGRSQGKAYKRCSLPTIDAPLSLQRLNALASFVEVFLAKENHAGMIGINFLEKLQTSNLSGIYGAMLAGVDYVLMGAGIPREIPGVLDKFATQTEATIKVSVIGASSPSDIRASFNPPEIFPKASELALKRPKFLAIISSDTLALHLVRKATGSVEGFVIEGATAGGHNAPPRGPLQLSTLGEPIYSINDEPNLAAFRKIGLPFWLAGTFGSPEKIGEALKLGATGVQVGTAFAFCSESGVSSSLRQAVIDKWCDTGSAKPQAVFTDPCASPTGFPFKVAPLAGTLSELSLYEARPRKCDVGYLRQPALLSDGSIVYRCPAEPVADFLKKGGLAEETMNRKCLCNALMSNIGVGQTQDDGYEELPLLTAGDDLTHLKQFLRAGNRSYSAKDVIEHLTT